MLEVGNKCQTDVYLFGCCKKNLLIKKNIDEGDSTFVPSFLEVQAQWHSVEVRVSEAARASNQIFLPYPFGKNWWIHYPIERAPIHLLRDHQ